MKSTDSPQSGKRCAAHRGGIYVVDAIVGESCVHQDWLVFVLIRRGDQSVRTRTAGVVVPVELHGRCEKRGTTQGKCETEAERAGKMGGNTMRKRESASQPPTPYVSSLSSLLPPHRHPGLANAGHKKGKCKKKKKMLCVQ